MQHQFCLKRVHMPLNPEDVAYALIAECMQPMSKSDLLSELSRMHVMDA